MRSKEEVLSLYRSRRMEAGLVRAKMENVQKFYNADDLVIPLPELDGMEAPAVANLMITGIDQSGARIASMLPDIVYPPLRPGIKRSEQFAAIRRKANLGWWEENALAIKMARRARHFIAYSFSAVMLRPDFVRGIPKWEPRDPLSTFPAHRIDPDDVNVDDCIFSFNRPLHWIQSQYPAAFMKIAKGPKFTMDDRFECIEYIDDQEYSLFVLGKSNNVQQSQFGYSYNSREGVTSISGGASTGSSPIESLASTENKAGICTVVLAGRVTLDKPKGQFDDMAGMFQARARLTALEIIAVEKGIFPATYLVAAQGQTPKVVTEADPKEGIVGVVQGGTLTPLALNPGFQTNPTIDRLERAERQSGGIPSEYGGESPTNIRTDRRGQSVMGSAIDYPIAEAQMVFQRSLMEENIRAIAISKAYFGNTPKALWVNWKGAQGQTVYTPKIHFETDQHQVVYPLIGSDSNGVTIRAGQAVGVGYMSKKRAGELDPLIDDVEREHERVISEGIEAAMLSSLQNQAQDPNSPLSIVDLARIKEWVRSGKYELSEAIVKVHEQLQQQQAAVTPQGQPDTALPGTAPAQPGLAPGQQSPQPLPGPPSGAPDVAGLGMMLRSLRTGQRQSPQEQAPVPVGR